MIDLDKKVANRICANTKGAEDVIMLDNNETMIVKTVFTRLRSKLVARTNLENAKDFGASV